MADRLTLSSVQTPFRCVCLYVVPVAGFYIGHSITDPMAWVKFCPQLPAHGLRTRQWLRTAGHMPPAAVLISCSSPPGQPASTGKYRYMLGQAAPIPTQPIRGETLRCILQPVAFSTRLDAATPIHCPL